MNKVKMFFIAAALVLTTAGVFAAKAKFLSAPFYVYNTTNGYTLITPAAGVNITGLLAGTGGQQAQITDAAGNTYFLYSFASSTYSPVYSTGW